MHFYTQVIDVYAELCSIFWKFRERKIAPFFIIWKSVYHLNKIFLHLLDVVMCFCDFIDRVHYKAV